MESQMSERMAEILGLKDDSYVRLVWLFGKYFACDGLVGAGLVEIEEMLQEWADVKRDLGEFAWPKTMEIYNIFLSTYLPQLAKALRLNPLAFCLKGPWYDLLTETMFKGLNTSILRLFFRTHPEAGQLHAYLVAVLASSVPAIEKQPKDLPDSHRNVLIAWTDLCRLCTLGILLLSPDKQPQPPYAWFPSDPKLIDTVARFRCDLQDGIIEGKIKEDEDDPELFEEMVNHVSTLLSLLEGDKTIKWDVLARHHSLSPRCDASGLLRPPTSQCSTIARDALLQCGRCKVVHYCSAEHQRVDWKRHKVSCVKPSWR